jgi:membrane-bound serine protease (ClpP class)
VTEQQPHASNRRLASTASLCLLLLALASAGGVPAAPAGAGSGAPLIEQGAASEVYVVPVEGMIDLGLAPFVRRVLAEAQDAGAAAVVLEINTFGGRVDAAVQIRDALLNSPVRTVAYVKPRAISAGALIALAAEKVAMAGGGTIGAATPVQAGAANAPAQPVEEKTVSYVRKEFRSTAEHRGRPPLFAEAMVDADVVIPGVIEKGKLLTLTTTEAVEHGIADLRADSIEAALEQLGFGQPTLRRVSANWAEGLVRFLTHPFVASLLMTMALVGILVELRTPGFGFAGAIGLLSLALFFWGHGLVHLAGWEEVLLTAAGLLLVALEVFVIPGFGVTGVLGIAAILAGLVLSLTGSGASAEFIVRLGSQVVFSLLLALLASAVLLRYLPRLPLARRLVLNTGLGAGEGLDSMATTDLRWLGKRGDTVSSLRPAGIAQFGGERVDVVSEGDFIAAGEPIEVVRVDGNRIVVKHVSPIRKE